MWFGFGHDNREPRTGEMATFCPACPQPGINLPEDWMEDPNQSVPLMNLNSRCIKAIYRVVYTRGFVMDGNFTAVHQKQKRPEDDVWLTDGDGFMVQQARYKAHLAVSKEVKEVSDLQSKRR